MFFFCSVRVTVFRTRVECRVCIAFLGGNSIDESGVLRKLLLIAVIIHTHDCMMHECFQVVYVDMSYCDSFHLYIDILMQYLLSLYYRAFSLMTKPKETGFEVLWTLSHIHITILFKETERNKGKEKEKSHF